MATKNRLEDLRNHLFEQLERLKVTDKPTEIARAQAVAGVANAIINSAKVELRFMEAMDRQAESLFWTPAQRALPPPQSALPPAPPAEKTAAVVDDDGEGDPEEEQAEGTRTPADRVAARAERRAKAAAAMVPCLACGLKFRNAIEVGQHQTSVHFDNSAATSRRQNA